MRGKKKSSRHISAAISYLLILSAFSLPLLVSLRHYDPYLTLKYAAVQFVAVLTMSLWLLSLVFDWSERITFHPVLMIATTFLALAAVSLLWATNPHEGITEIVHLLSYFAICFVTANIVRRSDGRVLNRIIGAAVLGGTIVALIGIAQAFGFESPMLPQTSPPGATFGYKNNAAQYLVLIVPMAAYLVLAAERSLARRLAAVSGGAMLAYLVFSTTRAAWLGLGVASLTVCGVVLVRRLRAGRGTAGIVQVLKQHVASVLIVLVTAVVIIVARGFIPAKDIIKEPEQGKIAAEEDFAGTSVKVATLRTRIAFWRNTWEMIREHPLTGVGYGNYKIVYPEYSGRVEEDIELHARRSLKDAHNDYIQTWAETGIFGLLLLLALLVFIAGNIIRILRRTDETRHRILITAISVSLLGMALVSMFSFPVKMPTPSFFFWLWTGVLLSFAPMKRQQAKQSQRSPRGVASKKALSKPEVRLVLVAASLAVLIGGSLFTFRQIEARRHLAAAYVFAGGEEFTEAQEEIRQAGNLAPHDFRVLFMRGVIENQAGDHGNAAYWYKETLKLHPNHLQALNNLGAVYVAEKKFQQAGKCLERALAIYPEFAVCHKNMGDVYFHGGDLDTALRHYTRSLELNADLPEAHYSVGAVYFKKRMWKEAAAQFDKVLYLDPDYKDTRYWLDECRKRLQP